MKELLASLPQVGIVEWIGIRPARYQPLVSLTKAQLIEGKGLDQDHYSSVGGKRQVTLINAEHITAMASFLQQVTLEPQRLRRNIVVRGLNLLALKDKTFRLGEAVLEYSGLCHPCSRMEKELGPGGYNAVRGHGGITARVIQSGWIEVGSGVQVL